MTADMGSKVSAMGGPLLPEDPVSPVAAGSTAPAAARRAHARLLAALDALQRAEERAVLCFAEMVNRRLYRDLGYATPQQYAVGALGFSRSRAYQFLDLVRSLDRLPEVRRALAEGEIGWTVARELSKVATVATQGAWLREAKAGNRAQLRRKIARARELTRAGGATAPASGDLLGDDDAGDAAGGVGGAGDRRVEAEVPAAPVTVGLRLDPEQYARLEALLEAIRKRPDLGASRLSREEILLVAAERLLATAGARDAKGARGRATEAPQVRGHDAGECCRQHTGAAGGSPATGSSPYRIVVHRCDRCGGGEVAGPHGEPRRLTRSSLERIGCDARVVGPDGRSTATIPPRVRRAVLRRDGHRCRAPGCGRAHFLEIHHVRPRAEGGTNDPENLVTLCATCHQHLHERVRRRRE